MDMEIKQNKIKREGLWHRLAEELVYIVIVLLGFYLAFLLRFDFKPLEYNIRPFYDNIPHIIAISVVVFYIYDVVSTLKKSFAENALIIFISLLIIDMATITLVFFRRGFTFPRTVFALGFLLQFSMMLVTKYIILRALRSLIAPANVLIVAEEKEGIYIEEKISSDNHRSTRDIVKYSSDGSSQDVYRLIDRVDKVFIGNRLSYERKEALIDYASETGKTVYLVPTSYEISMVDFKVRQADDLMFLKLKDLGLSAEERFIKRIMDIIISSVALVLLWPVMLVVALLIRLQDGRAPIYSQERVTKNGRIFNIYKFRTMIDNAEYETGPILAKDEDPRITPLGKVLRSTRLDELPQLVNVLKGDMSIVGPRPERPIFVEYFCKEIEGYRYRTKVKAGITGLAQVMGSYATSAEEKAKYDLLYIRNFSILRDIKIMFDTFKVVFIRDKSRGIKSFEPEKKEEAPEGLGDIFLEIEENHMKQ